MLHGFTNEGAKKMVCNNPNDYVALALFIKEGDQKTVSVNQVKDLENFMCEEMKKQNINCFKDSDTYGQSTLFKGHDVFTLRTGITSLDLAQYVVNQFDEQQLNVVLPPEVVKLLMSLVPTQELVAMKIVK